MSLPPLVEPSASLSAEQVERYSRHLLLDRVGAVGQRRLAAARVLVVGAGGLGSPALTYLAAAGVGTIGVLDDDVVEASNLQRQTIHGSADVGRAKVRSAAEAIAAQNPLVQVIEHPHRLVAGNALDVLGGYHLVLDGSDNFGTRYLVNDACTLLGLPWVWGSVLQFAGQVSVFWADHGPTLRDLYPDPPAPGAVPSCSEAGVLGVVCGAIGVAMATEAIKLICGIGDPLLGRVLDFDALRSRYRTIALRPDPARRAPTELIDDAACERSPEAPRASEIGAGELIELLAQGQAVTLIDVRGEDERARGVLAGSIAIPVGDIVSGAASARVRAMTSTGPVVLYCASGSRSLRAVQALQSEGVDQVRSLRGGLLSWPSDSSLAVAPAVSGRTTEMKSLMPASGR